ncbi:integrase arm-type DNA-binding domain-containing protein [Sphingomonas sp. LaA6.9]|uniref:tyrosine-type recombinase/integrase n=1 Tax=Sphingomonas sp. LaA6.9 TaxID=2919914 RepID=UPI001F4FA373|nr:integrase arm-type DNA-binding domain-containing protein [Sphingomonas sp. LaA6.9]MCJ8157666.1 integrase family protein [Sphingomonas sp. LaA6.9]
MKRQLAFTPAGIDALENGRIADPQTPGLTIEALPSGRKKWVYRRRVAGSSKTFWRNLGHYPTCNIAAARELAAALNDQIEAGIDPHEAEHEEALRTSMTVAFAHELYMEAVREGRASRAKRINKPRTIAAKLAIYQCDIAPKLAQRLILDIVEADLTKLVLAKSKASRVRANRLAGELKVFFGWAASLRGCEIGLPSNPAARLGDLKFAETPRERILTIEEIGWLLKALIHEERVYQRGVLLLLLTAARLSEVIDAKSSELQSDIWTIPAQRVKNSQAHRIPLGPWGWSLFQSNNEWVLPSSRSDGQFHQKTWCKVRDRLLARMSEFAGRPVEHWIPHDLRRTVRSNTKRLKIDYDTAEAMLNHVKKGLERTYDRYEMEEEKREAFLKWENEVAEIARKNGVASMLGAPVEDDVNTPAPVIPKWRSRRIARGRPRPTRRALRPV